MQFLLSSSSLPSAPVNSLTHWAATPSLSLSPTLIPTLLSQQGVTQAMSFTASICSLWNGPSHKCRNLISPSSANKNEIIEVERLWKHKRHIIQCFCYYRLRPLDFWGSYFWSVRTSWRWNYLTSVKAPPKWKPWLKSLKIQKEWWREGRTENELLRGWKFQSLLCWRRWLSPKRNPSPEFLLLLRNCISMLPTLTNRFKRRLGH